MWDIEAMMMWVVCVCTGGHVYETPSGEVAVDLTTGRRCCFLCGSLEH